jgi:AraC-like DNA-binding protein
MKQRLMGYSVYRNMFLSFVLLTAGIIALVTVILFALFSWSTAREVGHLSESMLKQNSAVSSVIKDEVYNIGNLLLADRQIVSALYDSDADQVKRYHASFALQRMQSTYPYIQSIGLYNGLTDSYMNTTGISQDQERPLLQQIVQKNGSYFNLFPRKVHVPGFSEEQRVLTFVLLPGYYALMPAQGALLINVDAEYIQSLIGGYKNDAADELFVVNAQGQVLTHSQSELFLTDLSQDANIQHILETDQPSGYFMDGERQLVTFVKSADMDWMFVSISDSKNLLFNMNLLKWSALGLALLIFGLSLAVSLWLTNHAYNPLRHLLDKMLPAGKSWSGHRRLNEFALLDDSYSQLKERLSVMESAANRGQQAELVQMLKGGNARQFERFQQHFPAGHYSVMVVMVDKLSHFRNKQDAETRSYVYTSMIHMAEEVLGADEARLAVAEEGMIAGVLKAAEGPYPTQPGSAFIELQSRIYEQFGLSVTIGIGPSAHAYDELCASYEKASACVQRRFLQGAGQIFYCDPGEDVSVKSKEYPHKYETSIIDAIKLQQRYRLNREIEQWLHGIRDCEYHEALFYMNQLVGSLYRQFHAKTMCDHGVSASFSQFIHHMDVYETLEEIGAALTELANRLCDEMEEASDMRYKKIVSDIKRFVEQHYMRPDLSLELVASEVGLSRSYVGKLFKAHCHISFNDYLNGVRLTKAKGLLMTSDMPVQVVSEQVGIYNTTYFYTLFKKHYKLSPAQYRLQGQVREETAQ